MSAIDWALFREESSIIRRTTTREPVIRAWDAANRAHTRPISLQLHPYSSMIITVFRGLMACETDSHINQFRFLDSQIVPLRVSGGGLLYICGTFHVREIRLERGKFPLGLEEDTGAEQGRHDVRP